MTLSGAREPSVKDVAQAAGVSLGTVSNVLNRPQRVSPATRARVESAMVDLGFVRNESARLLRQGQSRLLAYVMLDVANPFFTDVAQGIESSATESGLSLFLCNSRNDATREIAALQQLQQQRVQGILVTPVDPGAVMLDEIARHTPLVLVDRVRPDASLCSAAADDIAGGRTAIEHLVERGHTQVAYVGGPATLGQVRERHEGAKQAWSAAGMREEDLVHVVTSALSFADGREAGERIAGMPARRRPTAAFCANDLVALGLLQHAISAGRRVPESLAIVGFDDIDFAAAAAVPLTSVRQPRAELGRAAAALLLEEASGQAHTHRSVTFTPELVARESTRA